MALALSPSPPDVSNLIIADIAPTQSSLHPYFVEYLEAMSEIENPENGIKSRKEAGKILETVEKVGFIFSISFFLHSLMTKKKIGHGDTAIPALKLGPSRLIRSLTHHREIPVSCLCAQRSRPGDRLVPVRCK